MAAVARLTALCTLLLAVIMPAACIHEDDCLEYFEANSEYADLSKVPTYSRMIGYKRRSIAPGRALHLDVSDKPPSWPYESPLKCPLPRYCKKLHIKSIVSGTAGCAGGTACLRSAPQPSGSRAGKEREQPR